ncbi:glycosyltransferase family 2 protein [Mariprofundus ferrooxydans]|uniref:Glycosyltransferase involved in cell wall biogenesis-like protein n=2 Tax=Mariprofundus ferrooxydans TaxID=314344 RepID=Q0EZ98_9PROT|nr:glycosyltransferase family A protein [Mariprofundus ferrooxydans]EAU54526.1 Glycosyltransferase involved in cell wall biogenesis-like protein [Mariprofundus ferrooxydans PV-1]
MPSSSTELISVIISTYKGGELLQRAIDSLAGQTDRGFETIVVNDCSPCETTNAVCRRFEEQGVARVIWRAKNGGLSAGRNAGIKAAKGEIVAMLDEDDEFPQTAIADIRAAFEKHPEADFVFGNYIWVDVDAGNRHIIDTSVLCDKNGWLVPKRLVENWIMLGHSPCRKKLWRAIDGYRQCYSYDFQDGDFWMRALDRGFRGMHTPAKIYQWNQAGTGMCSGNEPRMRYFMSRNIRYYEGVGEQKQLWGKLVFHYMVNRNDPVVRAEAREVWRYLLPRELSRVAVFMKFSMLIALPLFLDKLLFGRSKEAGHL